jgi:Protein of unknown function (DUF2490)
MFFSHRWLILFIVESMKYLLIAIFILPLTIFSQNTSDVQFWNETVVSVPFIKSKDKNGKEFDRLSGQLIGTFRIGKNSIQSGDIRIGAGFEYRLNKFVSLQPSYIYRSEKSRGSRRLYESRFRFAVNLQKDFAKIRLRNRNMIDYRQRKSRETDPTFYRNRVQVIFPQKKFEPYIMNELYYDLGSNKITRNRLFFGFNKRINKNLTTDIFYVWQKNRTGTIKTVHGFGINLRIRIG